MSYATQPGAKTQRNLQIQGFRQKGFVAAKYGRPRMMDEQLRELAGEAAVRAYAAGWRVGQRERDRPA